MNKDNLKILNSILNEPKHKSLNQNNEQIIDVFDSNTHKISIIHSYSAKSDWMQQNNLEFAFLLEGNATIIDSRGVEYNLNKGDCIKISANEVHKITHTSKYAKWLAIHIGGIND
ncbi:cupin domain-containing protein [Mycoplasmopsis mucosicanis]|uniref:Cupin domain-containing protein n=1 Tax=Mycoplasmopsis mucosicanis TaxID=458208 RepID=A0A507SR32_9BACT|nr:cupin domain-containing protein [Mycoplasmopsis mucosicanis]TQC51603.1 cupin domain-containing protein [Mycoplasmopsis mucosicanis]